MKKIKFKDNEFLKTSFSQYSPSRCLEIAIRDDVVGVRHSEDPQKTTLCFTKREWQAFIRGVKQGEFDV